MGPILSTGTPAYLVLGDIFNLVPGMTPLYYCCTVSGMGGFLLSQAGSLIMMSFQQEAKRKSSSISSSSSSSSSSSDLQAVYLVYQSVGSRVTSGLARGKKAPTRDEVGRLLACSRISRASHPRRTPWALVAPDKVCTSATPIPGTWYCCCCARNATRWKPMVLRINSIDINSA